jgi:16S rRNA processing protein RimM
MVDLSTDWVVIGRFGRPHGIKGFITVLSFTHPRDNMLGYHDWHGYVGGVWKPLRIAEVTTTNKAILARLEDYSERENVASLTNTDIGVLRQQLPNLPLGEYYWDQLIGMQVLTLSGESLGQVTEILATGSNDVLVVEGTRRHLIPYLPDINIHAVNVADRTIIVDWDPDF